LPRAARDSLTGTCLDAHLYSHGVFEREPEDDLTGLGDVADGRSKD
jgi:hypothetical protein